LRKLQIPIKDIVVIFESEDMSELIQSFVNKLDALEVEITALSELRKLVDDFLHKMLISGVKKISAITLLYEETEKRLTVAEEKESITFEKLSEISHKALKLDDVRIIRLPAMRMLTSHLKTGQLESLDLDKMQNLFSCYGFDPNPGFHNCFFQKQSETEWIMSIEIPQDFKNETRYKDMNFNGGLYAVASAYMEDLDDTFILLRDWVAKSDDFELETETVDNLQRIEMIEEILPWDIALKFERWQQDIYIPIKIRGEV
jgi:hypothetical protein